VSLASGYLLHQRPFRDTSLILEIFARDHGRMTAFARGARGPRSRFVGLQPFRPLLLSWSGRGDAPQLTAAEPTGALAALPPDRLLSAFYLNELLIKLTAQHDPHPEVYDLYQQALTELAVGADAEPVLRRFERTLLELLGFGLELRVEAGAGGAVQAGRYYHFRPGIGVIAAERGAAGAVSGRVLLLLADGAAIEDAVDLRAARTLMRAAIDHCLEGRELKTRAVARSVARAVNRQEQD
jgi:DNA repair protein RecO (recombination protein O)